MSDSGSLHQVKYGDGASSPSSAGIVVSPGPLPLGSEHYFISPPPASTLFSVNTGHCFYCEDCNDIKDEVHLRPPGRPLGNAIRCRFRQTIPSSSLRYSKNETAFPRPLRFTHETVLYSTSSTLFAELYRDGWRSFTHPEGLKYYYHIERRVLTDANLQTPSIRAKINTLMIELFQICSTYSISLPQSYEIVLELYPDSDYTCAYYVVDNDSQTIFFLDDADTAELGLPDVVSPEHLKLQLHRQYWRHVEYFPSHRSAPKSVQSALKAILSHAWADGTTSDLSTSPYSPEVCHEFLQILHNFSGKPEQEPYRTCIIGRLMDEFTQGRFINLYGEAHAVRLANNQSIFPASESEPGSGSDSSGSNSTSTLYEIVCIMLLRQPDKELDRLNEIWVDKIAYTASWRRFVRERLDEWKNVLGISFSFTLIDTLLVVFLRGYASTSIWSPLFPLVVAYQLALMSLSLNICSTCIGLAAISAHAPYYNSTASNAASYFTNAWHKTHGFKPLSIALCLPRALAIWAVAGTTLSVASLTLESQNLANLLFSCGFTLSLAVLLVWAITYFQQKCDERNEGYVNVFGWIAQKYPRIAGVF